MSGRADFRTGISSQGASLLVELVRSAHDGDRSATFETAVETFSRVHSSGSPVPVVDDWYSGRIPLTLPNAGQQFAFEVALDSCTGCKACVVACHSLNGLDDDESWRRVGALFGVQGTTAEQRTVTTACHHCLEPACLEGCPVNAYEKDARTGAVIHLDDQCIGCSYCTMTCPYEVPQFNDRLGIVRKCDLCHGRLVEGESPACVQGCPNGAIRIAIVDSSDVRAASRIGPFAPLVPGCADSSLSVPTTRYMTGLGSLDGMVAEDDDVVLAAPAHDPLAAMLVLTQVGVGLVAADAVLHFSGPAPTRWMSIAGLLLAFVGIAASFAHLGRPMKAWRVVLGVRHSWLSREAIALGIFMALGTLQILVRSAVFGGLALIAGLLAVFTSVQVYAVTGRRWWSLPRVASRFGLTVIVALLSGVGAWTKGAPIGLLAALAMVGSVWSLRTPHCTPHRTPHCTRHYDSDVSLRRTAQLLRGVLRRRVLVQGFLGLAGACVVVVGALFGSGPTKTAGLVLFVLSALIERTLFFRAVAPDRMPGYR